MYASMVDKSNENPHTTIDWWCGFRMWAVVVGINLKRGISWNFIDLVSIDNDGIIMC